jgi:hypothetical protein
MRMHWSLGVVAFVAVAPAHADVTAHFVAGGGSARMTIAVNDRGDSRITQGDEVSLLTVGGADYLLGTDRFGTFVARKEDFVAVQAEAARAARGPDQPAPQADGDSAQWTLRPVRGGSETVGGRTGIVWTLRDSQGRPDLLGAVYVISTDADLAPVGRVSARWMTEAMTAAEQRGDTDLNGHNEGVRAIYAFGTVIRQGGDFALESVDTNPIPASEFALPSAPLSRAQLAARLHGPAPH